MFLNGFDLKDQEAYETIPFKNDKKRTTWKLYRYLDFSEKYRAICSRSSVQLTHSLSNLVPYFL